MFPGMCADGLTVASVPTRRTPARLLADPERRSATAARTQSPPPNSKSPSEPRRLEASGLDGGASADSEIAAALGGPFGAVIQIVTTTTPVVTGFSAACWNPSEPGGGASPPRRRRRSERQD